MTSVFVLRVWSSLLRERPEQDNRFSAVFDVKCAVGYCARTFDSYIFGGWIMSAPKNFGMYLQVYFLLVSYIPRGSRAVPFQVDGTHTHTHILGIYRFLSTTFFSVLFCLFPLFFVQVIWREEGKPRMDRFRWIHHRVLHVGKRSVVYQTHTHTQVKDGLGCCCPSLCVVVSEPDGGGRKPWERPARRDRNIYALASEVSFVIECTTEHPVRFLSFLFFS